MDWFQVTFLALLQGLTEFLPISSSGHLILPSQLFGWADQGLAFDVAVHVGTLLAVMLYFYRDICQMTKAWFASVFQQQRSQQSLMAWGVIFATIPACIMGELFNGVIEQSLRATWIIAVTTLLFGVLLWWADIRGSRKRGESDFTIKDAIWIGLAQTLALIPGTSRSGITITAGLMLGLNRKTAARFSFLLSIPLIMAAGLLKGAELYQTGTEAQIGHTLVGGLIAFGAALACIHIFLHLLDRIGMLPFVIYRLILGTVLLVFFV
ncbi:undecaprenyl-diphosphate phosphatase [Oceanospirillum linum]|uniref:Undecaprenyl-diphosphatase n=1 Tax=Oceanospirillum linum TaxID=966 RepID=A0A1T1H9M2_OCELI|nr:undecaprenyl-diphosphate phosphatase [Oceanospirillum linum]OOV86569.1 undecaprenyl-diphosphatase [Oceanospirillum linum]SEG29705.1 Undecaprenyl-diphosphatase [Oleiphilus messinensis]SMP26240.1 Undecaprenyl-diphosphatase [Oceanospirillum linum]